MTRDEIRLEVLKLAHAHGRDVSEVVARAKEYEKYVLGPNDSEKKAVESGFFKKKVANSDILS